MIITTKEYMFNQPALQVGLFFNYNISYVHVYDYPLRFDTIMSGLSPTFVPSKLLSPLNSLRTCGGFGASSAVVLETGWALGVERI